MLQGCQFLLAQYPPDLTESLVSDPEELESINVLTSDLDDEEDWGLADLTGDSDIGSRASIHVDYGPLCEMCSMVRYSVPSLDGYLMLVTIRGEKAMSRAPLREGRVSAVEPTLVSDNTLIGQVVSPIASKSSELSSDAAELSSTHRHLHIAKDVDSIMRYQAESRGPQVCGVGAVHVAAEAKLAAVKYHIQSLTTSESASRDKAEQLA